MKFTLLTAAVFTMLACNTPKSSSQSESAAPNTLTAAEQKDGWKLLFDGKTTAGWHSFNKPAVGEAWKVVDGTLYLDTAKKEGFQIRSGGDIVTEEEFENFDLRLEWKISKNGNSGAMFFIKEDPKYKYAWYTGPEMQILDNDGHADGKITKHRSGDLYDLIKSSKETVKPVGEWNQVQIVSNQGKLNLYLNGENVVSADLRTEEWKQLVAGSKFKTQPDFTAFKSGKIGLQDHGNAVWFRNVKIRRL
ncbi:MAG: DUF1080 domain-containing protein [Gemmatimonadaceae bacterium]|nr:DUF1080 domain-containing protein [Chitinophagaceae bacterium]